MAFRRLGSSGSRLCVAWDMYVDEVDHIVGIFMRVIKLISMNIIHSLDIKGSKQKLGISTLDIIHKYQCNKI